MSRGKKKCRIRFLVTEAEILAVLQTDASGGSAAWSNEWPLFSAPGGAIRRGMLGHVPRAPITSTPAQPMLGPTGENPKQSPGETRQHHGLWNVPWLADHEVNRQPDPEQRESVVSDSSPWGFRVKNQKQP